MCKYSFKIKQIVTHSLDLLFVLQFIQKKGIQGRKSSTQMTLEYAVSIGAWEQPFERYQKLGGNWDGSSVESFQVTQPMRTRLG